MGNKSSNTSANNVAAPTKPSAATAAIIRPPPPQPTQPNTTTPATLPPTHNHQHSVSPSAVLAPKPRPQMPRLLSFPSTPGVPYSYRPIQTISSPSQPPIQPSPPPPPPYLEIRPQPQPSRPPMSTIDGYPIRTSAFKPTTTTPPVAPTNRADLPNARVAATHHPGSALPQGRMHLKDAAATLSGSALPTNSERNNRPPPHSFATPTRYPINRRLQMDNPKTVPNLDTGVQQLMSQRRLQHQQIQMQQMKRHQQQQQQHQPILF